MMHDEEYQGIKRSIALLREWGYEDAADELAAFFLEDDENEGMSIQDALRAFNPDDPVEG